MLRGRHAALASCFVFALTQCAMGVSPDDSGSDRPIMGTFDGTLDDSGSGDGVILDEPVTMDATAPPDVHDSAVPDVPPPTDTMIPPPDVPGCIDGDHDGYGTGALCAGPDCNDSNASVHPGATEVCNGIDDNCNGLVDEGFGSSTCGVGACLVMQSNCIGGVPHTCTPGAPQSETCNGIDDDCDGVIDNGLRTQVVSTSYSTLSTYLASCDGTSERMGPDCNAAIHRFCHARGCTTSGFGPDENSGDTAVVSCVIGTVVMTSYTTLSGYHSACDGTSERIGADCNAAIHRFCHAMGSASGFGPVENSGDTAYVTCVPSTFATVVNTTYTTLSGYHSACDGTNEFYGPDCNAAIHRFCTATGHRSGFGPVEHSGDTAVVTCVDS